MALIVTPSSVLLPTPGSILSGTVFPDSPSAGDFFLFTPFSSVYQYTGSVWVNIQSLAAFTMYVDSTGSDTAGKGTGTGTSAFATFSYALDNLPLSYGGDVTIVLGSGNFDFPDIVESRSTNGYFTYINGNLTQELQSASTTLFRESRVTGGGQVQTTGSSTTVNVISGGNTNSLCVGGIVLANSLYRYVTAINSSTQFTVNEAVNWSTGYAWQYWNLGTLYDSNAVWSDNQYNDDLLVNASNNPPDPLLFTITQNIEAFPIKKTYATSKRLEMGCPLFVSVSSYSDYRIYSRNTTIRTITSHSNGTEVRLDNMVFRCVNLTNSGSGHSIKFNAVSVILFGCYVTPVSGVSFLNCALYMRASSFTVPIFIIGAANGKHTDISSFSSSVQPDSFGLTCYFTNWILIDGARCVFYYCISDVSSGLAAFFVRRGTYRVASTLNTNAIRNTGGATTSAIDATLSGILQLVTTVPGANGGGVFTVGFTSGYTVSAAQMSYAT